MGRGDPWTRLGRAPPGSIRAPGQDQTLGARPAGALWSNSRRSQTTTAMLNALTPRGGHWEHCHLADERTLKIAEEARKAIAQHGYYLLGAGVTPSEAFGMS